jgi:hypothetical protein
MSSAAPLAAPLVETTEDRLRRELAQSSQAQARETLLREECARLRADNRLSTTCKGNSKDQGPTTTSTPRSRPRASSRKK